MLHSIRWLGCAAGALALAACASYPLPTQRLADAEAATRSATDQGAATIPQGQLHLKLAQEGIDQAKRLIADGDNERADSMLVRAKSDAELALEEAREHQASANAQAAIQQIAALHAGNRANAASITTTTSATATGAQPVTPPPPASGATTSTTVTTSTPGGKP